MVTTIKMDKFAGFDFNVKIDKKLRGKWVVIIDGKLFASSSRADGIIKRAREQHPDKIPFVYQVPTQTSMLL